MAATQSALELYFTRLRAREHLPTHIAGVQRLSKAECIDDIETIKQHTKPSTIDPDVAIASEVIPNNTNVPIASAIATANVATGVTVNNNTTRTRRQLNNLSNTTVPHLRQNRLIDEYSQSALQYVAQRKRQRLESRIVNERHELDDVQKLTLTQLRGELDSIRNECVSYEEAIASSRREIELAKREKQELEEQFTALKGEYELSVATTETARADEEKAEIELRDRLAQATQIAADAQGRVDQLQLIETEFKTKDLTITHLREDVNKLNMEVQHLRNALQNKPFTVANDSTVAQQSSPTSPSVNGSGADKLLQNVIDHTAKQANTLSSAMHTAGINIQQNQSGIATAAKSGTNGILMVTGDFIRYVQVHNERIANSQKTIKTLQTERDHLAIQVQEREQLLHTQYAQIERITKFNADLQSTVKVSSALLHEERLKHQQTLKQMKLIQRQYEDTIELCKLFDNKIHAYDNVLQISDNRAIQAELGLHDNVHELKTLRSGLKAMQQSYNKLLQQHVMLQKYHSNICDLLVSTVGDTLDNETRDLLEAQNIGTTTPNTTRSNKKQLQQYIDGYQLQTYESLQDYKRLFQRMSDIITSRLGSPNQRLNTLTPTMFQLDTPPDSNDKSNGHTTIDMSTTMPTEQNGVLKLQELNKEEVKELTEIAMPDQ